ncbi:putative uncharacterized protein ENSP00000383407 [Erpetoichthys calabaricus]|uniref:putative uncharacterized protein ENSP00000383407 n=1 Tax=Erpetoichthys calabaricus TaxID=27687 RepID=UPI002234004D|nr:putative uncharacterized protein ENSP00000383407 [Erpetoichthys calabaricus]
MNLFCFSLEGSMDSLYEPVQDPHDTQDYTASSRPTSPAVQTGGILQNQGAEKSISLELLHSRNVDLKKKKRRAPIPRSTSHNESFDCNNLFRQTSRKKESSINNAKNHFQEAHGA